MSSTGSATQFVIKKNTNGTGTLDVKDPVLFNYLMQAMTGRATDVQLLSIDHNLLPSPFFRKLINEINDVYSANLYTSTWVCLRKLFENLLIEVLRSRYGTSNINLYYWPERRRFHDFSVLIENLSQNVSDFTSYTSQFDQHFFAFINDFKEQANSTAHSIDIIEDPDIIDKMKDLLNQYCNLLCDVIGRIKTAP